MSDYSNRSIKDLEELKENLLNQKSNLNNTIEEVINNIRAKKLQVSNHALREHPYYKDKSSYLKVVISDGGGYIVTKVTPSGKCLGIYQFLSNTIEFLKYYEMVNLPYFHNIPDSRVVKREYDESYAEAQRLSQNYRIQGSSADISKLAGIYLFQEILNRGWFNVVKIVNMIHDK